MSITSASRSVVMLGGVHVFKYIWKFVKIHFPATKTHEVISKWLNTTKYMRIQ